MGLVCEGDSNSIEVGSRWIMFHGAQVDLEDSLMDLAREAQILKLYKDHYFSEWFPVASASHNPNQLIEYPRRQTPYIRGYINRARMTYHPPNQEQRRTNQAFSPSLFSQPPRLHPTTPMKVRDGKANKFNYSPQHATPSRLGQRPSLTKKFKTPMKQSVSNLNDCDSRHPPQTKPTDISVENRPEYLWGDDDTHIQSMQEDTEAELWGNDDMDFLFEAVTNMSDDLSNNVFSALSNAGSMTLTDLVQLFPVIPVEDLKKAITSVCSYGYCGDSVYFFGFSLQLALGGMVHESSNGRIFVI
ncbi:hypothetical protein BJ742DRAFT_795563 [Cladochytrium replicatum]|nr:hypothetical protein BJ742DRAFT_795563 [Cladochytrium replicatum]